MKIRVRNNELEHTRNTKEKRQKMTVVMQ